MCGPTIFDSGPNASQILRRLRFIASSCNGPSALRCRRRRMPVSPQTKSGQRTLGRRRYVPICWVLHGRIKYDAQAFGEVIGDGVCEQSKSRSTWYRRSITSSVCVELRARLVLTMDAMEGAYQMPVVREATVDEHQELPFVDDPPSVANDNAEISAWVVDIPKPIGGKEATATLLTSGLIAALVTLCLLLVTC
jgi:hypothetical protein